MLLTCFSQFPCKWKSMCLPRCQLRRCSHGVVISVHCSIRCCSCGIQNVALSFENRANCCFLSRLCVWVCECVSVCVWMYVCMILFLSCLCLHVHVRACCMCLHLRAHCLCWSVSAWVRVCVCALVCHVSALHVFFVMYCMPEREKERTMSMLMFKVKICHEKYSMPLWPKQMEMEWESKANISDCMESTKQGPGHGVLYRQGPSSL